MSCVDVISLVIALELSSFPLYLLVPMRREGEGRRSQMESAIKYIMFGVAANGIMLFGLSYLFGLTGTTYLPRMVALLAAGRSIRRWRSPASPWPSAGSTTSSPSSPSTSGRRMSTRAPPTRPRP